MKLVFDLREDSFVNITPEMLDNFIYNNDLDIFYNGEKVGEILNRDQFWISSCFYSKIDVKYLEFIKYFNLSGLVNESE